MSTRFCTNCKNTYDDSLGECPVCKNNNVQSANPNDFNIRNPFLELSNSNNTLNEPATTPQVQTTPPVVEMNTVSNNIEQTPPNNQNMFINNVVSTEPPIVVKQEVNTTVISNISSVTPPLNNNELNNFTENPSTTPKNNPIFDFEPERLNQLREEEVKKEEEQKKNNNDKKNNYYKYNFYFLMYSVSFIVAFYSAKSFNPYFLGLGIISIILLFFGYRLSLKEKKEAGYVGVLTSIPLILFVLFPEYINFAFGIFLLAQSVVYIVKYKKKVN